MMLGETFAAQIEAAFPGAAKARSVDRGADWIHTRFEIPDEAHPLVIDVVASADEAPSRIVYMLPGSGLNFRADYFTPRARNLAHFLRGHNYLIVGISPREDGLTPPVDDPAVAAWGLAKRKRDIHKVIMAIDERLSMPYDLLGHSAGGVQALDYAATYSHRLGKVMVLDTTGPYDPIAEPTLSQRARDTLAVLQHWPEAHSDSRRYTLDPGLKALVTAAAIEPDRVSSAAFRPDGAPFTNAGAAHYALIRTAELPGQTSWVYEQSLCAGTYRMAGNPADDRFVLAHTPLPILAEAVAELGGGLFVTAQIRDLMAVFADDRSIYAINWANIRSPVVWINMALGRGDHPLGARLIRDGGNSNVTFSVVPGYGHADPTWSMTAHHDVWPFLTAPVA